MIIDTHAHYDDEQFDADREELLGSMEEGGIGLIVNAGSTVTSWDKIVELTERYPFIYGAVGVHPDEVGELDEEKFLRMADLLTLMGIPENYKVLFVQGGGTVQFAMVPMNLMKNGVACYVETGNWSKKAIKEAQKYGEVKVVASSADQNFSYIPDCSELDIPEDADYVYICENETINGTTFFTLPDTKGKVLVSDQSSMFLSRPCDVSKYGLIWAGVQKNVGPAGMAVVIIREDLLREDLPQYVPTYLSYKTHADNDSLYNTPNCWAIYCCGKVFKYLLAHGGLEAMARRNEEKAAILYDFLDQSKFFRGAVRKEDRSLMNVPFVTPSKEQDAEVVSASKAAGFDNLKGHKSVGGLRASIYNAMPKEGVEALVAFLKQYEADHA